MKRQRTIADPASPAAAATRLWRKRRARGLRVVPVELFGHEIEELVRRRFLKPDQAQDRFEIGRAVARVLERLCR